MEHRNARYSKTRVSAGRLFRAWRAFRDTPSIEQGVTLKVSAAGVAFERGGFAPTVVAVDNEGYGNAAVYWPACIITDVMMRLYIEVDPDEIVTVEQSEDGPVMVLSAPTVNPIRATAYGVARTGFPEQYALAIA